MKVLWTQDDLSIGRYDDNNYFVGEVKVHTKGKYIGKQHIVDALYFTRLDRAVKAAVELLAGRKADNLREYAELLSQGAKAIEKALGPLTQEEVK